MPLNVGPIRLCHIYATHLSQVVLLLPEESDGLDIILVASSQEALARKALADPLTL